MERYIAVIRISESPSRNVAASAVTRLLLGLGGVVRVDADPSGRALVVSFNRGRVTLAELVRSIEGQGLTVCGVAQSRELAGAAIA